MKRVLSSIVVLLIFFSCSIHCYAAENEERHTGDVYGKYVYYSNEGMYAAAPNNGSYEVTTDNGVDIEVSSSSTDLTLAVHQISKDEKECYDWFKSCIPQDVVSFIPYDFFFIDSAGKRVELLGDTEIAISKTVAYDSILWLSFDGEVVAISHADGEHEAIFKTVNEGGYYLLCDNADNVQPPQTGDTSILLLWTMYLLVSGTVLIFLILKKDRVNPSY